MTRFYFIYVMTMPSSPIGKGVRWMTLETLSAKLKKQQEESYGRKSAVRSHRQSKVRDR
jgi:hypothetical protein